MADEQFATLGMVVDSSPVLEADRVLARLEKTGERVERGVDRISDAFERAGSSVQSRVRTVEDAFERELALENQLAEQGVDAATRAEILKDEVRRNFASVRAAREEVDAAKSAEASARAFVQAQEATFETEIALVKEAQLRGFITEAEAEQAGQQAARAFNSAVLNEINQRRAAEGTESAGVVTALAGNLKNVDQAGRSASLGLGRLNQALVSTLRQATGTSQVTAQLANTIGSMALGGAAMVGALAGLAAIAFAYRKLTEDAREARAAQDDARQSLERMIERRRDEAIGPAGVLRDEIRLIEDRNDKLEETMGIIERLGRAAAQSGNIIGALVLSRFAENARDEYEELLRIIEQGEREINRIRREAILEGIRDEIEADSERARRRQDAYEQEIRDRERLAAERATAERAALLQGAGLGILTTSEIGELVDRWRAVNTEIRAGIPDLVRRVELEQESRALVEAISAAIRDNATPVIRELPSIESVLQTRDAADLIASDLIPELEELKKKGEEVAISWGDAFLSAISIIGNGLGGLAQDVAGIANATVSGFRAGGTTGAFVGGGLGILATLFGGDEEAERVREAAQKWNEELDNFVAGLTDGDRFAQLQRQAEGFVDSLLENVIATGAAEGPGSEAVSRLVAEMIRNAFETGGIDAAIEVAERHAPGLVDELREVGDAMQVVTLQAREAAKAIKEEAAAAKEKAAADEAARAEDRAFSESQRISSFDESIAREGGDPILAAELRRDRQKAEAQRDFDEGKIGFDLFQKWTQWIDVEFNGAVNRATQATLDAAAAEAELAAEREFQAEQDLRNLDYQIAAASGRDQEALDIRQFIELQDAIHEGRDQEYLDKLNELHLIQDRNLAAQLAERSTRDLTSSIERQASAANRLTSVFNAPVGFDLPGARSRASTTVIVTFEAGAIVQRSNESPEQFGNRIAQMIAERQQSGAPSLFG